MRRAQLKLARETRQAHLPEVVENVLEGELRHLGRATRSSITERGREGERERQRQMDTRPRALGELQHLGRALGVLREEELVGT